MLYMLIKSQIASKFELETVYTLDEALKIYALWEMDLDIERQKMDEIEKKNKR